MAEEEKDEFTITDKEIELGGEIINVLSFKSLYTLIEQKGGIQGSKETYKAKYLIGVIEEVRKTYQKLINALTEKDLTKETKLVEIFKEFTEHIRKITKKENLRFKVLQLLFLGIKENKEFKKTK